MKIDFNSISEQAIPSFLGGDGEFDAVVPQQ